MNIEGPLSPAEHLQALQKLATEPAPKRLPPALPLSALEVCPELFQPRRGLTEHHVGDLVRALRRTGKRRPEALEPILVIQAGARTFVVDGHHCIEAYKLAGWTGPVPVSYFDGPVEKAMLQSGRNNTRAKLQMRTVEKRDWAWRLVLMGDVHSKREIQEVSGVSDGLVAEMRRVAKSLGDGAAEHKTWFKARMANKGAPREYTDEEQERWKREQAEFLKERLAEGWGSRGIDNPDIAAMALEMYFGRRIGDLTEQLRDHISDPAYHADAAESDF